MNSHRAKRILVAGALAVLLLPYGRSIAAETGEIVVHTGKVDITHGVGGAEPIDQLDISLTFTNTEASEHGVCHPSDNPITGGLRVALQEGACGTISTAARVRVPSFTRIAPGFFRFEALNFLNVNIDALLRRLPTPKGTCGRFNLTLDALPLDLSSITANPVALSIQLPDGSTGCVTVTNAIVE
jgi:hypothetical protein